MNSEPQSSTPIAYQPNPAYENEVSLIDIVRVLLRRKKLVLSIMAATVCLGLLYAFNQPRVYQVETILSPPSLENIQAFNLLNQLYQQTQQTQQTQQILTPDKIYLSFNQLIVKRGFRKEFFDENNILEALSDKPVGELDAKKQNDFFETFLETFEITKSKKDDSINIFLKGIYKENLGVWLDKFVFLANKVTTEKLIENMRSDITFKINALKINIESKRSIHKSDVQDELGRLKEAYQIAKELGIDEHIFVPDINGTFKRDVSAGLDSISKSVSNSTNRSLYMKGTKVLKAEINSLEKRKLDDIHIVGLRPLQEQLMRLEAIKIHKGQLQAITIDKKAIVDVETIGPNRKLIVILSTILGGIFGVFAVFIMEFIGNFKKQSVEVI